ncbi:receptor-like protein 44 isoform X2 [Andrographis paniculata]|uniref:receptor-like protein 44 isoform X2 n=1 Tax=Andrographis paniculata TaxID=175694 RepID=UPI0021E865E4|nr:receptor-like protein 44 isoform X2 [Andrographis paniculata]
MATMISRQILTQSTPMIPPSIRHQKSLFSSKSFAASRESIRKVRFSEKPRGLSLVAMASSTATVSVPEDIGEVLGEVSIFTAAGEIVKFNDLWDQQEGVAVVALLRHFGCFCCWELASALKEVKEKFESAGVKLIAVGVGTPDKARLLAERGGMFVFKGKQLLYARKDEGTGDHAPLDEIFDICCKADPNDERCLSHLSESLEDPLHNLQNWTKSALANPCQAQGFNSVLLGITCNNGRIFKLSLPGLSLRGTISPYLSNCTNLQTLDLSSNAISGPIPPDLQYLVNLAVLNLSSNRLSGQIPVQLALCAYLNVIDLHRNELSGGVPPQLGLLVRLSVFDVSNNRLSGPIPGSLSNRTGNLPRFNASSYLGNKDLYGPPLGPMKNRGLSVLAIVGIGLGSGFVSLILSFTAVCVWLRINDRKMANDEGKINQLMPEY